VHVQKLERELQELSYLEGNLRQKVHHVKSASTLSSMGGSYYGGNGTATNAGGGRRKA
jgi:hypothetical protein